MKWLKKGLETISKKDGRHEINEKKKIKEKQFQP